MNINEIKAQEAREVEFKIPIDSKTTKTIKIPIEGENHMTAKERLKHYIEDNTIVGNFNIRQDVEIMLRDSDLQEQYVKHLEQDKDNMRKIINILCDTISQLI